MVAYQSKNVKTADDDKVILELQMKMKNVVTALSLIGFGFVILIFRCNLYTLQAFTASERGVADAGNS